MIARRRRAWLAGGAVFAASAALGILHSDYQWDGTWVLQVIARMHAGDVLYRDVFAGVPPLTFAVGYAATSIAGVELVVLKVLVAAALAISWFAGARMLRRLTASSRFDGPLAIAMVACAQPEVASLYQPLANMFLLLTIDAATGHGKRAPWFAGLWCGLAVLAKHTVGAYAGAAAVVILVSSIDKNAQLRIRAAVEFGLVAILCIALGCVPIVFSGGWLRFIDYAFLAKGTYLSVAGVPYVEELVSFSRLLVSGGTVFFAKNVALFVPIIGAIAAIVLARHRQSQRPLFIAGGALALAEIAGLFPRADIAHVIPVVPGLLVVCLLAWHALTSFDSRRLAMVRGTAAVIVGAVVVIRFAAAGAALASSDRAFSDLPHLRGILMPRAHMTETAETAIKLRDAAAGAPLFLLVPNAGYFYLTSGIPNPTPFDYPLKPAFGSSGEADTIARIARGEIAQLCMKRVDGLMAPDALQRFVETEMKPAADLGPCVLHRRR